MEGAEGRRGRCEELEEGVSLDRLNLLRGVWGEGLGLDWELEGMGMEVAWEEYSDGSLEG